jgi:2-methylisocitrate lyase-like PEP mutase family enzyme
MIDFGTLARTGAPLLLPGAHDALSARLIQDAGFAAYGVGGSALAATQLALPDAGLQSFGEYRDAVVRIMSGSSLPVMIDGENGFGDVKAVTRTVRSFEQLGIAAIVFEDLVFPPRLDQPPAVVPREEILGKLAAALAARSSAATLIIGRTDAAYGANLDEALARAADYQALGIDGIIATGLSDFEAYRRLRDSVSVPIIAVVIPGIPWFAPTQAQLAELRIEAAIYPAAILSRVVQGTLDGLEAVRHANGAVASGADPRPLSAFLRTAEWAAIDERFA